MYIAYILKSLKDDSFYYGSTSDLNKRLKYHNTGKSKYTKRKMPWIIHYSEEYSTRTEAIRRELFFKSLKGYCWLKQNQII